VQSGAHFYQQNMCETPMGPCVIAVDVMGSPLMTADAYGVGNTSTQISPPRWSALHGGAHLGDDWGAGSFHDIQGRPVDAPHARCNPACVVIAPSPTCRNISPQWIIAAGVESRLGAAVNLGETSIMPGQLRNQLVRTPQQAIRLADQELNYGLVARHVTAFRLVRELRPLSIIWPGMETAAMVFSIGVDAALEEGGDEVYSPITTKVLPLKVESAVRIANLPYCAKRTLDAGNVGQFLSSGFYINLRKSTSFGEKLWTAWTGGVENEWERYASAKYDQVKAGAKGTLEEAMFNMRGWLMRHRTAMADKWDWSRAADLMAHEAGWIRVPHKDAPCFRELRKGGYEKRYLPITRQMLPAITAAGRVHDSRDGWIDSRLGGDGEPV
jgi:hypothetical protein